jgi:AraC family transcriptional regulator
VIHGTPNRMPTRTPQGMFGSRLTRLFSLPASASLLLNPKSHLQMAMTRLVAPNGFKDPTPRIPAEKAFVVITHLKRPGHVKGWGSWADGRFRPVNYYDLGGVDIVDLERDPVALRQSGFDSVHIHIPKTTLSHHTAEVGVTSVEEFQCESGVKDEVILRWARMMLMFCNDSNRLPQLALDEMLMMFCAHLVRSYGVSRAAGAVVTGGLCAWQQQRATRLIQANLDGEIGLSDLAAECGLSTSHFARSFKNSFGVPLHRFLLLKRLDLAKAYLLHSHKSLLDIAIETGFSDQSAFNRTFRSLVGTSPGHWKRQNRTEPVTCAWSDRSATPTRRSGQERKPDARSAA